jgi:hypothetical protein
MAPEEKAQAATSSLWIFSTFAREINSAIFPNVEKHEAGKENPLIYHTQHTYLSMYKLYNGQMS